MTVETLSFRGADTLVTLRAADGTLWKKTWAGTVPWKQGDVVRAYLQILDPVLFSDKHIKEGNK